MVWGSVVWVSVGWSWVESGGVGWGEGGGAWKVSWVECWCLALCLSCFFYLCFSCLVLCLELACVISHYPLLHGSWSHNQLLYCTDLGSCLIFFTLHWVEHPSRSSTSVKLLALGAILLDAYIYIFHLSLFSSALPGGGECYHLHQSLVCVRDCVWV